VNASVTYCNDFASYDVYRQQLDVNNAVVLTEKVATITDRETNFHMDYLTLDLQYNKYNYYVVVVDNSSSSFRYPAPYGSVINGTSNTSEHAVSSDSIIPGKATPTIVGSVTVSNIGVASATVTWQTDQDTDAVVEFREKYLRKSNGEVDTTRTNTSGA
jgi:hypothetical protein